MKQGHDIITSLATWEAKRGERGGVTDLGSVHHPLSILVRRSSGHLLRLNSGVIGDHMVTAQMPAFLRVWNGGRFDSYCLTVSKRNEIFSSK